VLHLFAQYGHVHMRALLNLVYMIHIVSRYLDIYVIRKLSLDLGKLLATHAQAAESSSLLTVRARTGMCSSVSCIYDAYSVAISRSRYGVDSNGRGGWSQGGCMLGRDAHGQGRKTAGGRHNLWSFPSLL